MDEERDNGIGAIAPADFVKQPDETLIQVMIHNALGTFEKKPDCDAKYVLAQHILETRIATKLIEAHHTLTRATRWLAIITVILILVGLVEVSVGFIEICPKLTGFHPGGIGWFTSGPR